MNDLSASAPELLKPRSVDRLWRYVFAAVVLHVVALGLVWWSLSSKPPALTGMSGVVIVDLVSLGPNDATPTDATPTDATPTDATPTDRSFTDSAPIESAPLDSPQTETTPAGGANTDSLSNPEAVLPEPEQQARPEQLKESVSAPAHEQPLSEVSIEGAQEPPMQSAPEARAEPLSESTSSPSAEKPSSTPSVPASPRKPPAPVNAVPVQPGQSLSPPGETNAPDQKPAELPESVSESGAQTVNVSYLRNPAPAYPARALRQRVEGTVLLVVHVLASGQPGEIKLESSSGSALLDEAAISTVKTWRFKPAQVNGRPMAQWINVPITFQIKDR